MHQEQYLSLALSDVLVLELSRTWAAAFAGRLLADAGAAVLLVEPPDGHPLRHEGPFPQDRPHPEASAPHLFVNAGKRSLALELPAQAHRLLALLRQAHAFVTDVPAEELDSMGLSWQRLHQENPRLVMTRVTPFGDTGPYRRYQGTNLVCLALGGQMKITGDPGLPPLSNAGAQAEYQGGLAAFAGTVANLLLAEETGEGDYLDLSIQDVVANNLEGRSLTFNLGVMAQRSGLCPSAVYGVYPCADGWVFVNAVSPSLWERLKAAIGLPELEDPRFGSQASRLAHNDELQAIIASWTVSMSSDELRRLMRQGYPLTVAETVPSLLEGEQWRQRCYVHRVRHPAAGEVPVLGSLWEHPPGWSPAPAPLLGEANRELLGEPVQEG